MSRKNIITITGDLGSGKSSVARELCRLLGYEYFSTGNIQRELAQQAGVDTLEMNYFAEKNKEIDRLIDDRLRQINNENKSYVLDSRLAWHFVKDTFKVYLTVQPEIAAQRVSGDRQRKNEPVIADLKAKALNLIERRKAEDRRFKATYGIDCSDLNNYDVVMDTSHSSVKEVANAILERYRKWQQEQ